MSNSRFIIIAGEDLITSPTEPTYDTLIKEREIALKNENFEEWFRITKLLIERECEFIL